MATEPKTEPKAKPSVFEKFFQEQAHANFKHVPFEQAVKLLDQHCSGQHSDIWLAWCSVRSRAIKAVP